MNRALLVLAVLGAVLVAFTTRVFVPDRPSGQTLVFVAFGAALYPVARVLWFASAPWWRYWAGLAVGAVVGWSLDTWRRASLSTLSSELLGMMIVGLLTAALVISQWRSQRKRRRPGRG